MSDFIPISQFDNQFAEARAKQLANAQTQQGMNTQNQIAQGFPAFLSYLTQQQGQQTQGQPAPQPPMPGQPSVPSAPPMGIPPSNGQMPPMSAPGQAPVPPPSPTGMPPMGSGSPPVNAFGSNVIQNAATPQGGGQGPGLSRIPPQQPQMPQQAPAPQGGQQAGYDLPTVVKAMQQAYPNADGKTLMGLLQTINPLILTPAAKAQLETLKLQNSRENTLDRLGTEQRGQDIRSNTDIQNTNTRVGAEQRGQDIRADTAKTVAGLNGTGDKDQDFINDMAKMYGAYGPSALTGLPKGTRAAVEKAAMDQGVTPDTLQKNLAGNKASNSEATVVGNRAGGVALAQQEAIAYAPRVKELAAQLGQGKLRDVNSFSNLIKLHTNDPDLLDLQAGITEFVNQWARASTGRNPTRYSTEEFASRLDAAQGSGGINSVVDEALRQMQSNKGAAQKTMQDLGNSGGGNSGSSNSDPLGIR
jgi:hypothetical protein